MGAAPGFILARFSANKQKGRHPLDGDLGFFASSSLLSSGGRHPSGRKTVSRTMTKPTRTEPEMGNEVISATPTIKTARISCQIVFTTFIAAIAARGRAHPAARLPARMPGRALAAGSDAGDPGAAPDAMRCPMLSGRPQLERGRTPTSFSRPFLGFFLYAHFNLDFGTYMTYGHICP